MKTLWDELWHHGKAWVPLEEYRRVLSELEASRAGPEREPVIAQICRDWLSIHAGKSDDSLMPPERDLVVVARAFLKLSDATAEDPHGR